MLWLLLIQLGWSIELKAWPLPDEEKRKELTQLYLQEHHTAPLSGVLEQDVLMEPRMVVLHWTGAPAAKSTWNTFASAYLSGRRDIQKGGALNVGAHFLVDRDGTIYQLMDEKRIARHCIGLNHLSIGVENVGGGKKYPLTPEQVQANIALIEYLSEKYPLTHLIGHYEAKDMEEHSYFSEKNPKYRSIKPDPGADFMKHVREGLEKKGIVLRAAPEGKDHQEKED